MSKRENKTTELLYKRFFRGETEAVAELASEHRNGLILFINGYVRDTSVAEDLASDTFASLLVKRPKIKDASRFKTYLFSMAKNAALSFLRKNKRAKINEKENTDTKEFLDDPEHVLILQEERETVFRAIGQLAEDYRNVLILRFYEELSVEEISIVMKKSKKQVYNLLQRAKETLKNILREEGVAYETD
ncbi:MAG: sigma-70 family RNA polymerase sigma factor [Clostridia bacterium]|nr:sigma-70 family RNA polymerase sigma factor [Clostridia bacterium]